MIVSLVGLRGSGKSAVGRRLAERLDFDFVDGDEEIERVAGRSVAEIFAESGEPGFRQIEREVVVGLLERDRLVLASGGGAILDERTRADLRRSGPVCWLRASPETLAARVVSDESTGDRRPRLAGTGVLEEMKELSSTRAPLYADAATIEVETEGRTIAEVAEELYSLVVADVAEGGGE